MEKAATVAKQVKFCPGKFYHPYLSESVKKSSTSAKAKTYFTDSTNSQRTCLDCVARGRETSALGKINSWNPFFFKMGLASLGVLHVLSIRTDTTYIYFCPYTKQISHIITGTQRSVAKNTT